MSGEQTQANVENTIDSTNIFDEFSQDEGLKNEIKDVEARRKKDSYYYLSIINSFLRFTNIILFLSFSIIVGYMYIQNNDEIKESSYLDPLCFLFVKGDVYTGNHCGSVSSLLLEYQKKNTDLVDNYYSKILESVGDVYSISSFVFSKEVLFLMDRTKARLLPIRMLEEFDKLKNSFALNKLKLQCFNITILSDATMKMTCETYSSRWDSNIIGPSGSTEKQDLVAGTSVSLASSFVNYIEKQSDEFLLIDKPKKFSYSEVIDYGGYTRKTVFDLTLQLKTTNIGLLK